MSIQNPDNLIVCTDQIQTGGSTDWAINHISDIYCLCFIRLQKLLCDWSTNQSCTTVPESRTENLSVKKW